MKPAAEHGGELAVEFMSDGAEPSDPPSPDRRLAWLLAVLAAITFGVVHVVNEHPVTGGHGVAVVTTFPTSRPAPGAPYLASWRYGMPQGRVYGKGPGPDYLQVARGTGREILVVTMGSRGCPTLVTAIREPSTNRVIVSEGQAGGLSGCFLDAEPITNVLIVPKLDLGSPITVETGQTRVVVPVA